MTKRLEEIQKYVNQLITDISSSDERLAAKGHLSGVSSCCVLLALRRGLDTELAAISGLLHDIYRYKTGINAHHSHNSAEMARIVLKRAVNPFSDDEKQIILSAIFHHSDKSDLHGDYDEVLKDADTLDPVLYSGGVQHIYPPLVQGARRQRLEKMAKELNLSISFSIPENGKEHIKANELIDRRLLLAEAAENLAAIPIVGSRKDLAYMNLINYWADDAAADEFKNGWCAAFVYHCCQQAGFLLPIKWLTEDVRFGGVSAWNTWARRLGYFIKDEPGILPQRGDIILYRSSIPPENKPEEHRNIPIDHIGIVLACDSENLTVAEGNVNNQNVSGILTRPLHQNIEGYIRIDNSFTYDSWKFDYKTRTEQIENEKINFIRRITDKELFGTNGYNTMEPYKSVRVVLLDDKNLVAVLYLRKLNFYTLPGGGIEKGETPEQALFRETQEETGCHSEIICNLGVIEENSLTYNWSGMSACFLAKTKGEKGLLHLTQRETDEETQVQWYELPEALKIIMNQNSVGRDEREHGIMKFIKERDIVLLNEAKKFGD